MQVSGRYPAVCVHASHCHVRLKSTCCSALQAGRMLSATLVAPASSSLLSVFTAAGEQAACCRPRECFRTHGLRHSPLRAKCTKALQCTSAKQRECMSASPRAFPAPRDRVSCSSDSSGTVRCSQPAATRCSFWDLPDRSRWVRLVQLRNAVDSTSMPCLLTRLAVYNSATTYRMVLVVCYLCCCG